MTKQIRSTEIEPYGGDVEVGIREAFARKYAASPRVGTVDPSSRLAGVARARSYTDRTKTKIKRKINHRLLPRARRPVALCKIISRP